ncbi:MAG: GNAT family N-acetyltransferase [Christiangramia sp.]
MDTFKIPEITTERLILNRIKSTDHTNIFTGLSNPEVIKFYGVHYSSFEETQEQMNWYSNLEKSNSGMWWAIRIKKTEEFCGAIGFNDYQKEHRKAEIGFWLLPEYWGKGFIKEAAEPVIDHLFNNLRVHRIEAYVESKNKSSSKTLLNLGFKHEGKMVDSEIKNGNFISVDLYALLNSNN